MEVKMINDPLRASVLSVKLIPNVDAKMAEELNLPNGYRSIGIITADSDEAGEVIGIMAGPNPAEVKSGLNAAVDFIENGACFYSANEDDTVPYYAHCVSRTGSYLSKTAGVEEGEALAYLIAPPLEAMYALDAALKAADVRLAAFFGPPSETNFGGGLLTGSQSACKSACDAFAEAVKFVAQNPKKI